MLAVVPDPLEEKAPLLEIPRPLLRGIVSHLETSHSCFVDLLPCDCRLTLICGKNFGRLMANSMLVQLSSPSIPGSGIFIFSPVRFRGVLEQQFLLCSFNEGTEQRRVRTEYRVAQT